MKCTHVNDHADSGESSSQILWVGRPHSHRDDPRVETAIEGGYQVDTCRRRRREPGWTTTPLKYYIKQQHFYILFDMKN